MSETRWEKELKQLEQGKKVEYFKPKEGSTKILFVDEGKERTFEWEGDTISKIDFAIEVDKKPMVWSVTRGKTQNSLYGQLVQVAVARGTLIGQTINLLVRGVKMARTYLVMEAMNLPTNKIKNEKVE